MIGSYLGKKFKKEWARHSFRKALGGEEVNPFQMDERQVSWLKGKQKEKHHVEK